MFHNIPLATSERMAFLEAMHAELNAQENPDKIPLWQVPPETGRFLALLAASAPSGKMVEIGTSGGYSALWLSLAARESGRKLTTFEINDYKTGLATESFQKAGVSDLVKLVNGKVQDHLDKISDVSFCFLDASKDVYQACYDLIVPTMVSGGILTADNMISHADELTRFAEYVDNDPRVDAMTVPIGSGVLVSRKI